MPNSEQAELEMFRFFELTPDFVCIAGKDGFFRKVNRAVIDKLGYSEEELLAQPITSFIYASDRDGTVRRRAELLQGRTLMNFENRYVAKSGEIIWLHWTSVYVPEKEIVFALAKDVTERKAREREIEDNYRKFESLAHHFKTRLEKDKKHLATELHEELAQLASIARMNIASLTKYIAANDEEPQGKIEHSLVVLDLLIESIRRLSFSISPNMLDDVGLNETLGWLCQEFSRLSGINCTYESSYKDVQLKREIQLDLFRICQESLTNVMYHAQASSVKVRLEASEGEIRLTISDDGKGFHPERLVNSSGVDSMRKRAASIDGELAIQSEPGKGTGVSVTIAVPKP
jgi:PAS domain S-box-containing protein